MKHTFLLVAVSLVVATGLGVHYVRQHQTCAADNQQLHAVIKNWGQTNAVDLSRILTHMSKDNCRVES